MQSANQRVSQSVSQLFFDNRRSSAEEMTPPGLGAHKQLCLLCSGGGNEVDHPG